ncbi:MAG: hypothetical protein LBN95_05065 [Prevotellaceae bacterium]|jgi:hypothetical protein|nr:hypothetical protein [Prevotellaceae bacterium]
MSTLTLQFNANNSLAQSIIHSIRDAGVFRIIEENRMPYSQEFVNKIEASEEQFAAGKFQTIKTEDLWK